ncbi:hypothetical protein P154DRAFT_234918 [Amniculicola lignicola CBS 123094]|uniref:Uncharacterized protein n=1 Tax=Amniculicola lignicola CBS 123094 TaxID=1392246 RepID=A0A6A5WG62_9PLEO|nr:hypothetical protein P154DRAFT_234918 [Amniculicola lignicola CBS 123094]
MEVPMPVAMLPRMAEATPASGDLVAAVLRPVEAQPPLALLRMVAARDNPAARIVTLRTHLPSHIDPELRAWNPHESCFGGWRFWLYAWLGVSRYGVLTGRFNLESALSLHPLQIVFGYRCEIHTRRFFISPSLKSVHYLSQHLYQR